MTSTSGVQIAVVQLVKSNFRSAQANATVYRITLPLLKLTF